MKSLSRFIACMLIPCLNQCETHALALSTAMNPPLISGLPAPQIRMEEQALIARLLMSPSHSENPARGSSLRRLIDPLADNVSFGTICEGGHRDAVVGLNAQIAAEFEKLRTLLGRNDQAPLSAEETDQAYALLEGQSENWTWRRTGIRESLKEIWPTDEPPEIFFLRASGHKQVWWVGNDYAAAHFSVRENRIFISRYLSESLSNDELVAVALHEFLHHLGYKHTDAEAAHQKVSSTVDATVAHIAGKEKTARDLAQALSLPLLAVRVLLNDGQTVLLGMPSEGVLKFKLGNKNGSLETATGHLIHTPPGHTVRSRKLENGSLELNIDGQRLEIDVEKSMDVKGDIWDGQKITLGTEARYGVVRGWLKSNGGEMMARAGMQPSLLLNVLRQSRWLTRVQVVNGYFDQIIFRKPKPALEDLTGLGLFSTVLAAIRQLPGPLRLDLFDIVHPATINGCWSTLARLAGQHRWTWMPVPPPEGEKRAGALKKLLKSLKKGRDRDELRLIYQGLQEELDRSPISRAVVRAGYRSPQLIREFSKGLRMRTVPQPKSRRRTESSA